MACVLALGCNAMQAQMGRVFPSEKTTYVDEGTGIQTTLLTDTTRNDRFMYQTDPMWTSCGKYLMFRSSSRAEERFTRYYFIDVETGEIIQATDDKNIRAVYLSVKTNTLFFSRTENEVWKMFAMDLNLLFADAKAKKVKKESKYVKEIGAFPKDMGRPGGFAVSADDQYAYITVEREGTQEEIDRMNKNSFLPLSDQPVKIKQTLCGIRKMSLTTGEVTKLIDTEFKVGHIQTSRFTPGEIVFCNETGGDAFQRMWFCKDDGSNSFKPLYKETPLDWVTHETFASRDYVYFNILGFQPRLRKQASGIMRINLRTDDVELLGQVELETDRQGIESQLTGRGFWHCNASSDDHYSAGDTFGGNVWLIDNHTGHRYKVATQCKMKPDHAHPFFSPDGKYLLYQSGRFTNGKRLNLMMVPIENIVK